MADSPLTLCRDGAEMLRGYAYIATADAMVAELDAAERVIEAARVVSYEFMVIHDYPEGRDLAAALRVLEGDTAP